MGTFFWFVMQSLYTIKIAQWTKTASAKEARLPHFPPMVVGYPVEVLVEVTMCCQVNKSWLDFRQKQSCLRILVGKSCFIKSNVYLSNASLSLFSVWRWNSPGDKKRSVYVNTLYGFFQARPNFRPEGEPTPNFRPKQFKIHTLWGNALMSTFPWDDPALW